MSETGGSRVGLLLGKLYDAALAQERWTEFLEALAAETHSVTALLHVEDLRRSTPCFSASSGGKTSSTPCSWATACSRASPAPIWPVFPCVTTAARVTALSRANGLGDPAVDVIGIRCAHKSLN